MHFRAKSILVWAAVAAAGYLGLNFIFPTIHVRYRLNVEVMDGDQMRSGSSVFAIAYDIYPDSFVFLGGYAEPTMRGYAVTVDLGPKGLLLVTVINADRNAAQQIERNRLVSCRVDDIACLPLAAYSVEPPLVGPYSQEKAALESLLDQSGVRDVAFATLPKLVKVTTNSAPHKLEAVSPFDLAASFGPGVKLHRVTLELTDDSVTPASPAWPEWLRQDTLLYYWRF